MEVARFLKYIIFLILLTIKNIIVLVVHTGNISTSTECQNEYNSTNCAKSANANRKSPTGEENSHYLNGGGAHWLIWAIKYGHLGPLLRVSGTYIFLYKKPIF